MAHDSLTFHGVTIPIKRIMNNLKKFLAYFLVTILCASHLHAQETIKRIVKTGEIRIGMTGNQPPFAMKAKSGELIGYEVDMADILADRQLVKIQES